MDAQRANIQNTYAVGILARHKDENKISISTKLVYADTDAEVPQLGMIEALQIFPIEAGFGDHATIYRNVTIYANPKHIRYGFLHIYITYAERDPDANGNNINMGMAAEANQSEVAPSQLGLLAHLKNVLPPSQGWRKHEVYVFTEAMQIIYDTDVSPAVD